MSTRISDDAIERQLESIFDTIGNAFGDPTNEIAVARQTAARRTTKQRRARIAIGLGVVATLATGGTVQYAAMSNNKVGKPVDVRMSEPGRAGVLVPTWDPEDSPLVFQRNTFWSAPTKTMIWATGDQVVRLSSSKGDAVAGDAKTHDEQVSRDGTRFAAWRIGEKLAYLQASPGVPAAQFRAIRSKVQTNADGFATVAAANAFEFPLLVDTMEDEYLDNFFVYSASFRLSVSGSRRNPMFRAIPWGLRWNKPGDFKIRGAEAYWFEQQPGQDTVSAYWAEGDWQYAINAPDKAKLLMYAKTLHAPTDEEWEAMRRSENGVVGPSEPYVYSEDRTNEVDTVEVAGGTVTAKVAELAKDCAKVTLKIGDNEDKMCVKLTGEPVLWSGMRTMNGKQVAVAIVDDAVDAVRIVNAATPSSAVVNDTDVEVEWVSGTPVYLSTTGDKWDWIGLVALETDDPAPVLETFHNVNLDNSPADRADGPSVDTANEEPTSLRPLARTPIADS